MCRLVRMHHVHFILGLLDAASKVLGRATPVRPPAIFQAVPDNAIIEAVGLTKAFGNRRAVDRIDLTLSAGDCLALFGPNGAGKTTLLRLLAGLLKPSAGEARISGQASHGTGGGRAAVGLISHRSMLYEALTARENLEFVARLYGLHAPRAAAERALDGMDVLDHANTLVRTLSRGQQQRVSIARATVHDPRVVLLDEPYTGLDAAGSAALTGMLSRMRTRGATLVLVTHDVGEGLATATHAAIMRDGRIVRYEVNDALDPPRYVTAYRQLVANEA